MVMTEALSERRWRQRWSIGIYEGDSPLNLRPREGVSYPVLSAEEVTDAPAAFVADPFLVRENGIWHLFFELWNRATGRGEIGHAESGDGWAWKYDRVVLTEPFHLSYPYVFHADGEYYLIPESKRAGAVRLYRATSFPGGWTFETTLLRGRFVDPSLLRHDGRWWLFLHAGGASGLHIYFSDDLHGCWKRHPESPLMVGNRQIVRGGGRTGCFGGRLLRFTQDGVPSYGYCLRAMEIDHLTATAYAEHEVSESPVLRASRSGWNAIGMHHADLQPLPSGDWIAAVDGATLAFC